MTLWISIILALLTQELICTDSVLLCAYQQHYDFMIITALFLCATAFIIGAGFGAGKWIQKRFAGSRVVKSAERRARELEAVLGGEGSRLALVFLGAVSFNHLNAFVASWLSLPFRKVFAYLLLGDLLWYATAIGLTFGIGTFISPTYAMYIFAGVSVGMAALLMTVRRFVFAPARTRA